MNIKELNNYLQSLPEEIISDAAEIVAETATEYYKSAFKKKAFDGNPGKSTENNRFPADRLRCAGEQYQTGGDNSPAGGYLCRE